MEQSRVMEAAKTVADQLDHAQSMFRKGQKELCLAYMETIAAQGAVYWYAACMLLCQGIVMETPPCGCVQHGGEQCFQVGVLDGRTMRPVTDPLYPFATEIITVFSRKDWEGFTDRLKHVVTQRRQVDFVTLLLSRFTQLEDDKAAGRL